MKKLVLLSLAVGMFSVSFAEGLKRSSVNEKAVPAITRDVEVSTKITRSGISNVKPVTTQKTKTIQASNYVELGNVLNVCNAFGYRNINGPYIDYNAKLNLVATSHVYYEVEEIDQSAGVFTSYSTDGGKTFSVKGETVVPAKEAGGEFSTRLSQGGIYLPLGGSSYNDAYIYAGGAYATETEFEGQFMAAKKIGASTGASISKVASNPTDKFFTFEARYRTTAINPSDNSIWVAMPNFDVDGTSLVFQGNINILKSTIDAEGVVTTQTSKIPVVSDFLADLKMAWSPDGKFGVIAWSSNKAEGIENFALEAGADALLYVFTSDAGATWSETQALDACGPVGVNVTQKWIPESFYATGGDPNTFGGIYNNPEEVLVSLNWFDFDVIIDAAGNLYVGGRSIVSGPPAGQETKFFPGLSPTTIYYSTGNAEANQSTNVRKLNAGVVLSGICEAENGTYLFAPNMYANTYGENTMERPVFTGGRSTLTINETGDVISLMWADTNDQEAVVDNITDLDIFGTAWDLRTNKFVLSTYLWNTKDDGEIEVDQPTNFTFETDAEGRNHFLCVSKKMITTENGGFEVPMMSTYMYEIGDTQSNPFYYVGGVTFEKEDFTKSLRNPKPGEFLNSISEVELAPISAYPNPAVDFINVDVDGMVSIYNVAGKLLRNIQVANGQVNISDLPAGAMIMKAEGKAAYKFIKK